MCYDDSAEKDTKIFVGETDKELKEASISVRGGYDQPNKGEQTNGVGSVGRDKVVKDFKRKL